VGQASERLNPPKSNPKNGSSFRNENLKKFLASLVGRYEIDSDYGLKRTSGKMIMEGVKREPT